MIRVPSIQHSRTRSGGLTSRKRRGGTGGTSSASSAAAQFSERYILALRISSALFVLWCEVYIFQRQIHACAWPSAGFGYELTRTGSKPFKLLLLADPQLLDLRSFPDRSLLRRYGSIWATDNYARKAWRMVLRHHKPDAVFFLGDLLDSGVEVTDRDEHSHYVHRFENIFPPIPRSLPMHYIPGNHDLGLHLSPGGSAYARERFTETFGPLNGHVDLGNHTLVWVDAPGLLDERAAAAEQFDTQGFDAINGGVVDFLRGFAQAEKKLPRILLSHIPLYRQEGTNCGPLRESRSNLHQDTGRNFQKELDQSASSFLLSTVDPSIVFSGDDHDYCAVTHYTALSSPNEITCKSFSSAVGITHPGYQLVSLLNPMGHRDPESMRASETHHTRLCLLPDQNSIYSNRYVPFALLVIFLLAIPKMYFNLRSRRGTTARSNGLPVHSRNSLSRSLLGSRRGMKSYEEEQDEFDSALISDEDDASFGPHRGRGQGRGATPDGAGGDEADDSIVIHDAYYGSGGGAGYPMSPPHTGTGNQYAYHSPTDDDWMHVGTPREIVPRQGQARVRRVSRVWAWDPKTADDDYLRVLKRLGPLYRYLIRPCERGTRRVFHKIYGRRMRLIVAKLNYGNVLGETLHDSVAVTWVALLVYSAVYCYYLW